MEIVDFGAVDFVVDYSKTNYVLDFVIERVMIGTKINQNTVAHLSLVYRFVIQTVRVRCIEFIITIIEIHRRWR